MKISKVELQRPIIIAGPCAAESVGQMVKVGEEALKRDIQIVRGSLWKPRTEPGWDGLKEAGISSLIELSRMGVIPATEVLNAEQASTIRERMAKEVTRPKVLMWIGSRNQNHDEIAKISNVVAETDWAMLLVKNQPWRSEKHWKGIVEHALSSGIGRDRLLICHRGFDPGTDEPRDPEALRNLPDFSMALRVKREKGLPMVVDPSHIGGSIANVLEISRRVFRHQEHGVDFDGLMIEVHNNPNGAKTDAKQQLTWKELDCLLDEMRLTAVA